MAVRVRSNGRILCAAMHPARSGDTYLNDGLQYILAVELRVLVTEPMYLAGGRGGHQAHGEWWWSDRVPDDVEIDGFYLSDSAVRSANLADRSAQFGRRIFTKVFRSHS